MLVKEQQKKLQEDISALEGKNRQLEMLVDQSSVDAVKKAQKKAYKATCDKNAAIEKANEEVAEIIAEAKAQKKEAKESMRKSMEREYISYGLVAVILLIATSSHLGFWLDLVHAVWDPLQLAGTTWIGYVHPAEEVSSFERWLYLIVIPVIVIGSGVLLYLLGVWFKKRWNLLTVVVLVLILAITIICGDWFPLNRFVWALGLMIVYVAFCEWADRKWTEYPTCDKWKRLQKDLVWA